MTPFLNRPLLLACGLFSQLPSAWAGTDGLAACAAIADDAPRLACFDALARAAPPHGPTAAPADDTGKMPGIQPTPMASHWELDPETRHGLWTFRAHRPNYILLGRYTNRANEGPYAPLLNAANDPNVGLDSTESKFQLSFKLKMHEDLLGRGIDLWFGYTQQSHWQVFNKGLSAPFRETNYAPEVFLTLPTDYTLFGLRGRFASLGLLHQSNGQSGTLSRSWNRVYAQFGWEYGDRFNLIFQPWYRLKENADDDDNPDIRRHVGDFEAVASYRLGKHTFSLLGRSSFGLERGLVQLDWTYPLRTKLKGYLQFTSGHGESLIDYNHRQHTIGIGVMLTDWM